jgi:hypothetical protein
LAANRPEIPSTVSAEKFMADHKFICALCWSLGADVFHHFGVLVADNGLGLSCGTIYDEDFYNLS